MPDDQTAAIAFLSDPATHGGVAVDRIDTHGAIVFLAGPTAYKLKRAVAFPYMDFSTAERRAACCRAEIAINRRTAPTLYQRVACLTREADGRLALDGSGTPVDWLVVMRRFDQDCLFDRMAARGALTPSLIEALADAVATFHDQAEPRAADGAAALRWVIEENFEEFRATPALFAPAQAAALEAETTAALQRLAPLLSRRGAAGFVRACHGDLHLRNICLFEGRPTLFDAIEFNEAIATIDVLYDLAFLLMDLLHRGLATEANRLFNRYLERSADRDGIAALPLFLSTRAAIRAKVGASTLATLTDRDAIARLGDEVSAYLRLAARFLSPPKPMLLAVGGLSGAGKTAAAQRLAAAIGPAPGAVVLRSDVIRKTLLGHQPDQRLPDSAYQPETTRRVYGAIAAQAAALLKAGHAVIADAVHAAPGERAAIRAVADAAGCPFRGCWLEAPMATLLARVGSRRGDASDADAETVRRQAGYHIGPLDGWQRIDASGPLEQTVARIRATLPDAALRHED